MKIPASEVETTVPTRSFTAGLSGVGRYAWAAGAAPLAGAAAGLAGAVGCAGGAAGAAGFAVGADGPAQATASATSRLSSPRDRALLRYIGCSPSRAIACTAGDPGVASRVPGVHAPRPRP